MTLHYLNQWWFKPRKKFSGRTLFMGKSVVLNIAKEFSNLISQLVFPCVALYLSHCFVPQRLSSKFLFGFWRFINCKDHWLKYELLTLFQCLTKLRSDLMKWEYCLISIIISTNKFQPSRHFASNLTKFTIFLNFQAICSLPTWKSHFCLTSNESPKISFSS